MRERTHGEGFATRAIHAGERPDPVTHAHNTPIYATATFAFDTAAEKEDAVDRAMAWDPTAYFYSRTGNPTNRALEEKVASLEGAEDCVVVASGMASVAATLFAPPRAGDHVVVGDELFAITTVLMEEDLPKRGIGVTPVDTTDLAAVEAAITPATRVLFLEMLDEPAAADRRTSTRSPRSPIAAGSPSSPTTRSSGRPCSGRSSTAPTSCSTPRRSTCPGTATRCPAWSSGPQGADRPDPQADRHVRPGGQPVLELPRAARRADAAAPVGGGLGERGARWRRSSRPTRGSSGSATRASRRTRTTRSRRGCWATASARWSRSGRAAAMPGWPRSRTTSGCATSAVSLGDVFTLVYPQPKRGGLVRVSVGCEDVEDLLTDFELGLSFVA